MISRKENATRARSGAVTGSNLNKSQNNYNPNWLKATALTAMNLALLGLVIWGWHE